MIERPDGGPTIDCFGCIPDYAELRDAIAADDWHGFQSELGTWPAVEITHALAAMAEHDDESYHSFTERHSEHALAKVGCAYRSLTLGRQVLSNQASSVGARHSMQARALFARAEAWLVDACAIDPTLASAWAARLTTARSLILSPSEVERRYTRLHQAGSDFWGEAHYLASLDPKWSTSLEVSRSFIDRSLAENTEGSLTGLLVPMFYLERWRERSSIAFAADFLADSDVQAELDSAAARSVLHESRQDLTPATAAGHQIFLTAYWLADEKAKASVHRTALGSRTTTHYWDLLAIDGVDPVSVWRELSRLEASHS